VRTTAQGEKQIATPPCEQKPQGAADHGQEHTFGE
jgi:hypothetical protein